MDRSRKKNISLGTLDLSVVIPVYFNEESLEELYQRLAQVADKLKLKSWEVIFVDDDSKDKSRQILAKLRRESGNVGVIHLMRNSGSPRATTAGLERARGRAIAVIAADLQDPPEMIEEMYRRWKKGSKLIMAQRGAREDSFLTVVMAKLYYWIFRKLISKAMPAGGFDVFLADREVTDTLVHYSDKNSNLFANLIWFGFHYEMVTYHKQKRNSGKSRWTLAKKITYFYDSLLPFTFVPLRGMTVMGGLSIIFAFVYILVIIGLRIIEGESVAGWTSLMVINLVFGGLILTSLGMLGEYIWRTFDVTRRAPSYLVADSFLPRGGKRRTTRKQPKKNANRGKTK